MSEHSAAADRYVSEAVMQLEQRRLWPRVWQLAGIADDMAEPGAYFTYEIGPETIVVIRAEQGLRAFHNVCRHRGHPLCASGHGRISQLACPFHGWRYDLDGVLTSIPGRAGFPVVTDLRDVRLQRVSVTEWQGFVWIHLDPDAPPLADYLGEMGARLAAYHLDEFVLTSDQTVEAPCNWKVSLEGHSEGLHIPFLHPMLDERFEDQLATRRLELIGDHAIAASPAGTAASNGPLSGRIGGMLRSVMEEAGVGSFSGTPAEARAAIVKALRARREFDVSDLADDLLTDYHHHFVFPNVGLNLSSSRLNLQRERPHPTRPDWCFHDEQNFERRPRGTKRPPRPPRSRLSYGEDTLGPISDQDLAASVAVQRSLASRAFRAPLLGELEALIPHILGTIDRYLQQP